MVQLKAFKQLNDFDELAPEERRSSSSSSSINSLNTSTISGGNLTTAEEQQSTAANENQQPKEEESTTLSSNEEYQIANHDIIEEESGSDGQENEAPRRDSSASRLELERDALRDRYQVNVSVGKQVNNEQPSLAGNRHFKNQQFHNQHSNVPISSPKMVHSMSSSGLAKLNANQGDSVSQCSFIQRQNQANQFEIRWHDVNLYASKSKLPRFVRESAIYKYLKSDAPDKGQQQSQIAQLPSHYRSPIIGHRLIQQQQQPESSKASAASPNQNLDQLPADWNADATRQILQNVSGAVQSGQLTGILGPSGVGKTTLLNSLTGRNTLEGTGRVLLLGASSLNEKKRMSVVTVPQEDVLPGRLTVLEDLQFTSKLKNPQRNFDHVSNIERIVKHLNMEKFLKTRIEKLSGGEARRLSIGRELLAPPDIMILDEPTSGLDANTCKKIIQALRDIVVHSDQILDRPMTIIVTIHQPQQEVLNLFHKIYVMASGGRAIYEGPPNMLLPTILAQSSIGKLSGPDKNHQLNENPAIVAIEVASGEFGQDVIDELALNHEAQMFEDYNYSISNFSGAGGASETGDLPSPLIGNYSPFSLPRTPAISQRLQPKSPISVTPRFGHRHVSRLTSVQESSTLGRQSPVIMPKQTYSKQPRQLDQFSNVTSLSYASTYDNELPEPTSHLKVDKRLRRSVVMKSDFIQHTRVLMERCWLLTTRDLFLMGIRVLGFLLVAGGIVQIFSHALDRDENQCPLFETEVGDLYEFMGRVRSRMLNLTTQLKQASSTHLFFFHLVLCTTMVTSALTGLVFPFQMRMFMREYKNGWYSPASFLTSLTLAELPIDMIGPTLTLVIVYPLCNQPASDYYWRELAYISIMIISSMICKSQAQIVGAFLMNSVENSVFISCVMVTPPALLSGIAVRVSQMSWLLANLSYGSFLRYAFESFFVIRYGYGICPCDPELINGYPAKASVEALPPQLDRMARGFLELGSNSTDGQQLPTMSNNTNQATLPPGIESVGLVPSDNIFLRFLQLVSSSSNQFVPKLEDLGSCDSYRSLYLLDMGIEDRILPKWFLMMLVMFVISRIVTYFAVKLVIRLRKRSS